MTPQEIMDLKPMAYWSLPKNASDAQKQKFKKMLEANEYILTLKKDGASYRSIVLKDEVIMQSRTVNKKTNNFVEKQDRVPHLTAELANLPKNTIVLGEICFNDSRLNSNDIVSIMGCLPDKAIERQKGNPLYYYIYDVLMYDGKDLTEEPYESRLNTLLYIQNKNIFSNFIQFVEPVYENIEATISEWLERGEEGGLLMHKNKPYVLGPKNSTEKRPAWTSIKIKQELIDFLDLVIMGTTAATQQYTGRYPATHSYWQNIKTNELVEGNYHNQTGYVPVSSTYFQGLIGGFELGAYYNGNLIKVCSVSNLTDELREDATKNFNKYRLKVVKVSAMQVDNERRSLRHPVFMGFHENKNAKDCLYEDIFR